MPRRAATGVTVCLMAALQGAPIAAQDRASAEAAIHAMRSLPSISSSDRQRIHHWVSLVIAELTAAPIDRPSQAGQRLRQTFAAQVGHTGNSEAFRSALVAQTAAVAATHFADPQVPSLVATWLARVLLDMNAPESLPGLLAGLSCHVEATRYLAVRAVILQQRTIAADDEQVPGVVQALREAGVAESSPIVLSRIYAALALPGKAPAVLDAYLAIFDKRLAERRAANTADGAEKDAFLFFSDPATLNALSPPQKKQLVARVAVFLRLDAERYSNVHLKFVEIDSLERQLVDAEAILKAATGTSNGADIAAILQEQGRAGMSQIPAAAAKWIGDASTSEPGMLNAAPWDVPLGAP